MKDCTGIPTSNAEYWQEIAHKGVFTEQDKQEFKEAVVQESKSEIDAHTDDKKEEIDNYTTAQENSLKSELDTYTTGKERQLDTKETALEADMTAKKNELIQEISNAQDGFDDNVTNKTNAFNQNASEKTATLNGILDGVEDMVTAIQLPQFYVDDELQIHSVTTTKLANIDLYYDDETGDFKEGVKAVE